MIKIKIPPAFSDMARFNYRYCVYYGGRGGAKSWAIARFLLAIAAYMKLRILCTRELQTTIADSVYKLLIDQITLLNLTQYYDITKTSITSKSGSEFLFKGLKHNINEIKSLEAIDICWVEGTLVDGKKIETIKAGDFVQSYNQKNKKIELQKVLAVSKTKRSTTPLGKIILSNQIEIIGTINHPVYVKGKEWVKIKDIQKGDILFEKVKLTRENKLLGRLWGSNRSDKEQERLLQKIWWFVLRRLQKQTKVRKDDKEQSDDQPCIQKKNDKIFKCQRGQTHSSWRQWARSYKKPATIVRQIRSGMVARIINSYKEKIFKLQSPNKLQNRLSKCLLQIGDRITKRTNAFWGKWARKRQEEGYVLKEYRVDSVEILEQGSIGQLGLGDKGDYVYNLEVEINNNYFANGVLVHNCWVEEAQSTSEHSWMVLIPTIRKEDSKFLVSFNTGEVKDPTYQRFVVNPPADCITKKISYRDNPYFPEVLEKERQYLQRVDFDAYQNIWEGEPLSISNATIFKGKYRVDTFETREDERIFHGSDWGFSNDPTTLMRCFIRDNKLYIDYEAYGIGVEMDEIPTLFRNTVPTADKWMIKADNSRPETISYLRKQHGLNVTPAKKWQGSVEDGISYMKKFEEIIIHPRCTHMIEEMKSYSYKQDAKTGEVLPIIIDKNNHCIDAVRYALDGYIHGKTSFSDFVWGRKQ